MSGKNRGFNALIGAVIVKVNTKAVNEVVLTDENGVDYVIEVEVVGSGIPVISLTEKRVTAKTLKAAKKLYSEWCANQGMHCNRFPSFDELSDDVKNNWINEAACTDEPPKSPW